MLQNGIENHKGNEKNGIRMDSVKAQIAKIKPKICFWVIKEGPKCPLSTATTRKPICGDQLSVRSPLLEKNDIGWTGSNFPKITLTVLKRNYTFCGVMKENSSFLIQGPLTVCLNQATGYCEKYFKGYDALFQRGNVTKMSISRAQWPQTHQEESSISVPDK